MIEDAVDREVEAVDSGECVLQTKMISAYGKQALRVSAVSALYEYCAALQSTS